MRRMACFGLCLALTLCNKVIVNAEELSSNHESLVDVPDSIEKVNFKNLDSFVNRDSVADEESSDVSISEFHSKFIMEDGSGLTYNFDGVALLVGTDVYKLKYDSDTNTLVMFNTVNHEEATLHIEIENADELSPGVIDKSTLQVVAYILPTFKSLYNFQDAEINNVGLYYLQLFDYTIIPSNGTLVDSMYKLNGKLNAYIN